MGDSPSVVPYQHLRHGCLRRRDNPLGQAARVQSSQRTGTFYLTCPLLLWLNPVRAGFCRETILHSINLQTLCDYGLFNYVRVFAMHFPRLCSPIFLFVPSDHRRHDPAPRLPSRQNQATPRHRRGYWWNCPRSHRSVPAPSRCKRLLNTPYRSDGSHSRLHQNHFPA